MERNKYIIDKSTVSIMRIILEEQNGFSKKESLKAARESEGSELYDKIRKCVKNTVSSTVFKTRNKSTW